MIFSTSLHLPWQKSLAKPEFHNLAQTPKGMKVRVVHFSPSLPADRRNHLQAYGVLPGYCVQVMQHSPVTVIRVEHTELALENELAALIEVEVLPE